VLVKRFININKLFYSMSKQEMYKEIIETLKKKHISKFQLEKLKIRLCSKYKIREMPKDIQILLTASKTDLKKIKLVY